MLKPRALRPGDRLAVIAPASSFERAEFDDGVAEIERLGFVPVYDESVFAREGFVAGAATTRAAAIRNAWEDPSIGGLIGVRGGYGSAQVLPLLDREIARRAAKPFIGYSDLTALLTFHVMGCEMVAFHGPMLAGRLGRGDAGYDRDSFERVLCQREPAGEIGNDAIEAVRTGEAQGMLVGGTVTQLLASLGTPYAFDPPAGCVLFLDEVGERPYRLDRMLTQLKQSGLLARARAVVVGELPRCDEPDGGLTGRGVVADALSDFPGPVVSGFPSGHTLGPAMTLPFGVMARVVSGHRCHIVILEGAVQ